MLTAGMALAAVEFVQFVGVHTEAGLKSEPVTSPPTAGPGLWRWLALVVVRGFWDNSCMPEGRPRRP